MMENDVQKRRGREKMEIELKEEKKKVMEEMREIRSKVRENEDYVGEKLEEEERKIKLGEKKERGIYGEEQRDEVNQMIEEGVEIMNMKVLNEEKK